MIALNITDQKIFMSHFLAGKLFDDFLLSEGSITTFCTFSIDGTWQRDFYDPEKKDPAAALAYTPWPRLKDFCLTCIRGKTAPLSFKFVFLLPPEKISSFLSDASFPFEQEDIYGLYVNLSFKDQQLRLTTGTSLRAFTLDRSVDSSWDLYILSFLKKNGIAAEQLQ